VVCEHFTPPEGFQPSQLRQLLHRAADRCSDEEQTAASRLLVPFLACGDLSGAIVSTTAVLVGSLQVNPLRSRSNNRTSTLCRLGRRSELRLAGRGRAISVFATSAAAYGASIQVSPH